MDENIDWVGARGDHGVDPGSGDALSEAYRDRFPQVDQYDYRAVGVVFR